MLSPVRVGSIFKLCVFLAFPTSLSSITDGIASVSSPLNPQLYFTVPWMKQLAKSSLAEVVLNGEPSVVPPVSPSDCPACVWGTSKLSSVNNVLRCILLR